MTNFTYRHFLFLIFIFVAHRTYSQDEIAMVKCDQAPIFSSCVDLEDMAERDLCTQKAIISWIRTNIRMPDKAKEDHLDGKVYIEFIIDKSGKTSEAFILKTTHECFSKPSIDVVLSLPQFTPAQHNGELVKFKYTFPITFKTTAYDDILKHTPKFNKPITRADLLDYTLEPEGCTSDDLASCIEANLKFPFAPLLRPHANEAELEISTNNQGEITDFTIVSITDPSYEESVQNAIKALGKIKSPHSKTHKSTYSVKISIDHEEWLKLPGNYAKYYSQYYDMSNDFQMGPGISNSRDYSSTFEGKFDFNQIILSRIDSSLVEMGYEELSENDSNFHIFTKYTVDSRGTIMSDDITFENTSPYTDEFISRVINSLPRVNPATNAENVPVKSEHELFIFFHNNKVLLTDANDTSSSNLPTFPGECSEIPELEEAMKCTERELIMFCQGNVRYPEVARNSKTQGKVFASFVVTKTGIISDIEILQGVSPELNLATIEVINKLPRFVYQNTSIPPTQMKYTIPINFKMR